MELNQYRNLNEKKAFFDDCRCIKNIDEFDGWEQSLNKNCLVFRGVNEAKFKIYTSAQVHFLTPPFPKILRCYSFHLGFRISIGKRLGDAAFLFSVPLEFERLNFGALDFEVIHFHLVGCSPKIRESVCTAVGVPFHVFTDGVVFPKYLDIVSLRHGSKIVQYGVADPVIPEVIQQGGNCFRLAPDEGYHYRQQSVCGLDVCFKFL